MFTETAVRVLDRFAAPHGIDRYVEQVVPTWSTTEIRARVTDARHTTADSVTLTLRPNRLWAGHEAGQYTQLTVEIDGVRHTRCYSLSNAADAGVGPVELTVKAQPDGLVSNHLVDHAARGTIVTLTPARGDFTLPAMRPDHLLLISGGSGITPVLGMLRTLCAEGHTDPVTFVHYARSIDDHICRDEIERLAVDHPNVTLVTVYTDAPRTGDLDGNFSADQLEAIDSNWADAEVFVCGPAPLMDAVAGHYEDTGLGHRAHREAFTLPEFIAEAGDVGGAVAFTASDVTVANDGRSILEQAEASGLRPQHGCRMGICHTCVRPLTCGTVKDLTSGDLTTGDGSPVRICVNAPVGDVELDL